MDVERDGIDFLTAPEKYICLEFVFHPISIISQCNGDKNFESELSLILLQFYFTESPKRFLAKINHLFIQHVLTYMYLHLNYYRSLLVLMGATSGWGID